MLLLLLFLQVIDDLVNICQNLLIILTIFRDFRANLWHISLSNRNLTLGDRGLLMRNPRWKSRRPRWTLPCNLHLPQAVLRAHLLPLGLQPGSSLSLPRLAELLRVLENIIDVAGCSLNQFRQILQLLIFRRKRRGICIRPRIRRLVNIGRPLHLLLLRCHNRLWIRKARRRFLIHGQQLLLTLLLTFNLQSVDLQRLLLFLIDLNALSHLQLLILLLVILPIVNLFHFEDFIYLLVLPLHGLLKVLVHLLIIAVGGALFGTEIALLAWSHLLQLRGVHQVLWNGILVFRADGMG